LDLSSSFLGAGGSVLDVAAAWAVERTSSNTASKLEQGSQSNSE